MRDAVHLRDVLPFGDEVDMFRAIGKCHAFWNNNLRATTEIFVDSEFLINFTVASHTASHY